MFLSFLHVARLSRLAPHVLEQRWIALGQKALRPVTAGEPQSDASVAIWSAQRNSDLLAEAIGKPVEVVGPDS